MTSKPNLFFRRDTLFGACQGVGDDLGINPLWLRLPLAATILYSPTLAFGLYALLCVGVFATRMIWPVKTATVQPPAAVADAAPTVAADNEQRELAQAA